LRDESASFEPAIVEYSGMQIPGRKIDAPMKLHEARSNERFA
jgi:hypothetical protein